VMTDALLAAGEKYRAFKLPILRGVGVLAQALVLGIRALRCSAEESFAEQDSKQQTTSDQCKVSSWLIAGNLTLALGINILLFVVLPLFITRFLQTEIGFESSILFNAIDGILLVSVFVIFLYSVFMMVDLNWVVLFD